MTEITDLGGIFEKNSEFPGLMSQICEIKCVQNGEFKRKDSQI